MDINPLVRYCKCRQSLLQIHRFKKMKTEAIILVALLITLGIAEGACPMCEKGTDCSLTRPVRHLTEKKCVCSLCIKLCYDRSPLCPAGQECVMKPLTCPNGFNCGTAPILSAVCEPFTECKPLPDSCQCPESGHLKDQNGCDSCLCNDPCKELKCSVEGECPMESVQPDAEPTYECPV